MESPASGKRVALLACAGAAREQLHQALRGAGAAIVLEDDPGAIDVQALAGAEPQVVLVALEAAMEDALVPLEDVLHDPAITVIYDDAELAARREGWEARRWARHLAAKLHGHADVLPPGREQDDAQPQPGLPLTPQQIHAGAGLHRHLEEARGLALELPRGGLDSAERPVFAGLELSLDSDAWQPPAQPLQELELHDGFGSALSEPPPLPGEIVAPVAPLVPVVSASTSSGLVLELESLHPTATGTGAAGAVLLFAGIGGPDAVRKVLAELPEDLPCPVLVQVRLDGGRFDNLVKQMARAASLPVQLAKGGDVAQAAHVYVLPDDVAVGVVEGVVHFSEGVLVPGELVAALPPAQSVVLLLSGSDPGHVDPALALAARGGLVVGQSPQGCYDPAASRALQAKGGAVATPADLATRVVEHLFA